jgi:predicted dithiol-disulfide oxidoreductase (DUF899 family)
VDVPNVVSRDEWRTARLELLAKEKESSRVIDGLAAQRRALPMVRIEKDYRFEGPQGNAGLVDLFDGRRQLIVYHFMWLPDDEGCPSCSFAVDNMPDPVHLRESETSLVLVSRGQLASIERFRARMGWTLPWYSSYGSDFNYDFHVTNDAAVAPVEYNYKDQATLEREGLGFYNLPGKDGQGVSVFLRDGDQVFHTYSTYGRGADVMLSTYNLLDLTPLGRQRYITEFPHHDRYGEPVDHSHH